MSCVFYHNKKTRLKKKKIERDQDSTYVKVNMDQKGAQPSPTSVKMGLH